MKTTTALTTSSEKPTDELMLGMFMSLTSVVMLALVLIHVAKKVWQTFYQKDENRQQIYKIHW